MRTLSVIALVSTVLIAAPALAASGVSMGQPVSTSGGTAVNPGDVYGTAEFELTSSDPGGAEAGLTKIVNAIIQNKIGNNEGSYLLTIELVRNGEAIVQRPIISVTYNNQRFLFINWSTKVSRGATFKGKLLDTEAVDQSNNDVEVVLRSYFRADSTFDLSIFDALDEINKNFNVIAKFDAIGLSSSLLATIKGELGKALERSTESEDLFRHAMAFAQLGTVTNRTRELTVPIRYSYSDHGSTKTGALQLRVRTWSVSSQFVFDPVAAKFTAPLASTYINNTSIIINGKRITVFDFLKENGEDNVRSFIKALQSPEGYKQADIFSQCSALLTSYRKYLSNRDAMALMWATISEFRFDFKRSNGVACIEGRKAEFENLGLPTTELIDFLKAPG